MNKTVTVNIGGLVFHIDENAYERFKQYLESIRQHFTGSEGRDEIMQDIESRIAEMFQEKVKDKQVITLADVEEVTGVMGKPEQFGDEAEKEEQPAAPVTGKVNRRLYRNPDDKLVGGVCSGVAAYFDIDAVWIRLAFALIALPFFFNSFFGSALLLYILLWIIIPEAQSTTEKLQMRGEPINISNIEKNVVEERELQSKPGTFISRFFDAIGQLLKFLLLFAGKLIAVFFIFIGVVIAFAVFASLLALFKFPGTQYPVFIDYIFPEGMTMGIAVIGAVLAIGIPFLAIAFIGARMLFKVKPYSRSLGIAALSLWIIGVVTCILLGIRTAGEFRHKQSVKNSIPVSIPTSKRIILAMNEPASAEERRYWNSDEEEWEDDFRLSVDNNQLQSRSIKIDILKSPTDSFRLDQIYFARGSSKKAALERTSEISYSVTQADSVLKLSNYFTLNKNGKYRSQKIQLVLYVPVGGEVRLDPSLRGYIYDIENVMNIHDHDMLNRTWRMTATGLTCIDCDGTEDTVGGSIFSNDPPTPPTPPVTGRGSVHIDENGVYIEGDDQAVVKIDSNGVVIRHRSEKKK